MKRRMDGSVRWPGKALLGLALATAVVLFFVLDLGRHFELQALAERRTELVSMQKQSPLLFALAFFAVYVAVTGLSLPGAAILTLAAGALFGLGWGTLLVSFASTCGATLALLSSRFVLRDWVAARFTRQVAAVDRGMERDGAYYLLALRLVPVFPFFLVNLVMGVTRLPVRTFFWVSQVGMLAGTLVYVNAGTRLGELESVAGVLSPALLASLALLGVFPLLARGASRAITARRAYAGWTRPKRFDRNLIVIGAGSAGLVTSYIAALLRAKVTLVEKGQMGGDCLNTGCVPSKALLRSAKLLAQMARAQEFGLRPVAPEVDFAEVMERVQRVVRTIAPHDSIERYSALGVEVLQGTAVITSPWSVQITSADATQVLTTRAIVIATGARPVVPPIPGLREAGYLTSEDVWELRELPRRLIVLGGGPIGAELAQAFARFGAQVTQIEQQPRILPREDEDVSEFVESRFRDESMRVLTGCVARRVVMEQGERRLVVESEAGEIEIPFDRLLVAVGRTARLEGYGLEALGIDVSGGLETNEFLQTRLPNIYAAGDVVGPYQFTHVAAHQAWYASVNALFDPLKKFRVDYSVIPRVTFVDPEVARVGLNELEAKEQGVEYELTRYDLVELDRAIADEEARGFLKVLTVPGKDRILGVTIVGAHAGELLAEFVLAMRHGIGLGKLLGTIHAYPTLAEANKFVAGEWRKARKPERLLGWVARLHAWRRGGSS